MPLPENPIFIVGHWRTGSTFLHQLLDLDPNFTVPTLFQVAIPDSFLISHPYYKPLLKRVISGKRPMDNVKLGMDEPQEDEYAIYRITDYSPLERLVFPKSKTYFLLDDIRFLPEPSGMRDWEETLGYFFKKLSFKSGKVIVSKNPFNSMRIPELSKLFPQSKFIHIIRHPYQVVPSTIHMWNIVQKQNCLNDQAHPPSTAEVVNVFSNMLNTIEKDLMALSPERQIVIRYEDLECQTLDTLEKIYQKFNMTLTEGLKEKIMLFLQEVKTYEKNSFSVSPEDQEIIQNNMNYHLHHYGYV